MAAIPTTDDYLGKIIPQHRNKPKFVATVAASIDPVTGLVDLLAGMPEDYDLDTAIGAQLDVVGQWIGQTRNVQIPLIVVWFSFDTAGLGFDEGIWKGPYDPTTGVYALDDDTYRNLLYAKIIANGWDGSSEQLSEGLGLLVSDYATSGRVGAGYELLTLDGQIATLDGVPLMIMAAITTKISVENRQDMTMVVGIGGKIPSPITLALLASGYSKFKPGGVGVSHLLTSSDGAPLFGFDASGDYIAGFDVGAFGISIESYLGI